MRHFCSRPLFCLSLLALVLSGCSKYQLTLNEAVVYTPAPLFTDFKTADPRLKTCLDQAIKDHKATSPADVTRLVCSHAGLTSVVGLEAFTSITELNLANNQITDIAPIAQLSKLKALSLSDNKLRQVPEILLLEHLNYLDLTNNTQLACGDINQLRPRFNGELKLPTQCQ